MQKLNNENGLLKKITNSSKNIARKVLLGAGLASFSLLNSAYSSEMGQEKIIPQLRSEQVESSSKKDISNFVGSVYGEGGIFGGIFDANPAMLNTLIGYNIERKSERELGKGALLFPSARVLLKGDRAENPYNNHVDFGLGATYLMPPFIIGIEEVHREPFKKESTNEDFFRLWGGYWDLWRQKNSADKIKPLDKFQEGLWGTKYLDFDYNTFEENFTTNFRVDANLDILDVGGIIISAFGKGKVNYDSEDMPWNRFSEVGGGIRIRKGPFNVFFESGHRESSNKGGLEGNYNAVYAGAWFPIRF